MYKQKSFNRQPSRPGVRHFGPNTQRRGNNRSGKQYINPSRFVKTASPAEAADYQAQNSFDSFDIHPLLKSNITTKGYTSPSEIQDKTIPVGLSGRDIVGVANTGTGKTVAFALPILNKLLHEPASTALIISPTRELAVQIEEQCRQLSKNSGLRTVVLIGGKPMGAQIAGLRSRPRIIIGTPGRIKDHIQRGTLDLSRCALVVLDEVDRMLDMGFINDVRFLLDKLPAQRQSFFFSATLSPQISTLIGTFTHDPITINVKAGDTSDNVHQAVINYSGKIQRLDKLHDVLIGEDVKKTLVFGETKYGVERLARELQGRGFKVEALHGGKSQGARQRALDNFRDNRINVLVATDVAARGIDVIDITHVINFDVPKTYDDYSHRIGRAGRAGRIGHALTFVESV